jgi:tetratricopeptide (TPR) repeat protein
MRRLAILATLTCLTVAAKGPDDWSVAKSSHFEVYSQTGHETARAALIWFEQLRTFFQQSGLLGRGFNDQGRPALRVIGFRSEKEYEAYRLRPIADAGYVSDGDGDYIIMASLQPGALGVAAHEYAHYVLHVNGLKMPACLSEGVAEVFSTLRLNGDGYELGGDLPSRTQILKRNAWLPLTALLESAHEFPVPNTRKGAEIFYAESWALVDMLMTSPHYSARFREFVSEINSNSNALQALRKVYDESIDEVARSLNRWVGQTRSTHGILRKPLEPPVVHSSDLPANQVNALLAKLLLISGHLEAARVQYEKLSREEPGNPDFPAAMGVIALRQGNRNEALKQWRQALSNNVTDAALCYRYALLAEESGVDAPGVRAALERAVALYPGFDDARYKLALLQEHVGEYRLAVEQLKAMRVPAGARRYGYWISMATALTELDARDEAKDAAQEAVKAAQNEADRLKARQMAYIAATDLTVQFATDAEGHSQVVTTRVPHGTKDWNPFIEASDRLQSASGKLGEVLCTAGKLSGFLLRTTNGPVTVEVPDPLHVLMRNGPQEFFCGSMQEKEVSAVYAIVNVAGRRSNVLRGMTFQ